MPTRVPSHECHGRQKAETVFELHTLTSHFIQIEYSIGHLSAKHKEATGCLTYMDLHSNIEPLTGLQVVEREPDVNVTQWSDLPLVLTTDQAAAVLQLKRRTIANMLDRGDLHGVKVGKEWRVSRAELVRFVEGGAAGFQGNSSPNAETVPLLIDEGGVLVVQAEPFDDLANFVQHEHELRVGASIR